MGISTSNEPPIFIAVSGSIAAGKTTLCENLGKTLGMPVFHESVEDNPYLTDFYRDPVTYSFRLQVYFLNQRLKQHKEIASKCITELPVSPIIPPASNDIPDDETAKLSGFIQDRTIYEDKVFAQVLRNEKHMSERDHDTYVDLFQNMIDKLGKPDIIIFLDVPPETCLARIKER